MNNNENKFIMPSSGTFLVTNKICDIFKRKELEVAWKKNIRLINSKFDKIIYDEEDLKPFVNDFKILKQKLTELKLEG